MTAEFDKEDEDGEEGEWEEVTDDGPSFEEEIKAVYGASVEDHKRSPLHHRGYNSTVVPIALNEPDFEKFAAGPSPLQQPCLRVEATPDRRALFTRGEQPILLIRPNGDIVVDGKVINDDIELTHKTFFDWFEMHCGIKVRRTKPTLYGLLAAKLKRVLGYIKCLGSV